MVGLKTMARLDWCSLEDDGADERILLERQLQPEGQLGWARVA